MPQRSSNRDGNAALRQAKVRSLVSGIFAQATGATPRPGVAQKASHAAIARRLGVTEKTIARWIKNETPLDYELVLATPVIGRRFRELLCIHKHDELPYIARKRSRKSR